MMGIIRPNSIPYNPVNRPFIGRVDCGIFRPNSLSWSWGWLRTLHIAFLRHCSNMDEVLETKEGIRLSMRMITFFSQARHAVLRWKNP